MSNLISLFTDASWHQDTGCGGWAYWAKCDTHGPRWGGGAFRRLLQSSNEAEVCAVANAVYVLAEGGTIPQGSHLLIQTDCEHVVRLLRGQLVVIPRREREARDCVVELLARCGSSYSLRHVKGHTQGSTPRTWVNNMCDRVARQAMRSRLADTR